MNTGNTADVLPLVVETKLWLRVWWYHVRLKNAHLSASDIPGIGGAHSQQAQTTEREVWWSTLYCGKGRDKKKGNSAPENRHSPTHSVLP